MRQAARIDENQTEVVDALRAAGCCVAITSMMGKGFPDLVVRVNTHAPIGVHRVLLMEVKNGAKPLTADEQRFCDEWNHPSYVVVRSVDEALRAVGIL